MTETNQQEIGGFVVRRPLKLYKSKRRRYVRLEISEPVSFARIDLDRPLAEIAEGQHTGTILNISGGGVLMICEHEVPEGDYIAMTFELKGCEMVDGVVGKVKRVDDDGEGGFLMGVEFSPEEELKSVLGEDNIGTFISSFDQRIKRTLLKYIFARRVDDRIKRKGKSQ